MLNILPQILCTRELKGWLLLHLAHMMLLYSPVLLSKVFKAMRKASLEFKESMRISLASLQPWISSKRSR